MASKLHFTPEAEGDLEEIAVYTRDTFGDAQEAKYAKALASAFSLIASFPQIGSDISDIKPDARRYIHVSHAIYYRVRGKDILVLRILGPGQDPIAEFGEET